MHQDELDIDESLVCRLLKEQFPHRAGLPLRRLLPLGTVNAKADNRLGLALTESD